MNLLQRLGWPRRPLVSVVVASYNHQAYVKECLQSVLDQDFQDFEIVVTDDGSTDQTADHIRDLSDSRIHLKALPQNSGACVATNDAILRSRGRYIAILNSDDYFLPGKLSQQVQYLREHPEVGAVFGLPAFINEQGQAFDDPGHRDRNAFTAQQRTRHEWLRHFFNEGNALCHPTALIRREVYDQLGLYDPRLAQVPDLDMWIRLASRYELHVMPQTLTAFRVRDGMQNASAPRPEVIIRDLWERAYILRHYLRFSRAELLKIFPELAPHRMPNAEFLARYALARPELYYQRFALDVWFESLPDGHDHRKMRDCLNRQPLIWRDFIAHTGRTDLHQIRP